MNTKYRKNIQKEVNKRKYIGLFMCIILLFAICCAGCSNTNSNTLGYKEAENSVVVVSEYVALDGDVRGVARGSGFFIGKEGENPQYLITNHHVIADYLFFGGGQYATYTDEYGVTSVVKSYVRVYYDSKDYVEAYVVGYNEVADVAVLRLEEPTDKRSALQLCSPTADMVGSKVYALGFPGFSDNMLVDSVTNWGLKDLTFTSGIISRLTTTSGTGVRNIQLDVAIGRGNSGGPIVNENGAAVGISTWKVKTEYIDTEIGEVVDSEEAAYAVNIDEVITLLKLHSVPYTMESETNAKGTSLNIGIVAGVAGAVVLLIVIVAIVSLTKNKKKGNTTEFAGNNMSATMAPEMLAAAPASQSSHADDSGYRIQGLSGALEGRRFMIRKNTPLTFGRNSEACNVVLPATTAGVSGKHCQVWYEGGRIWIKDLGSSHGTFLTAGKKLSAGQAIQIRPGERFSLGSDAESFVLTQKGGN